MLFNSIAFLIFLPVVFSLYWFVLNKNLKTQNFLLLAASYVFYGWWDWRFLSLILLSSIVDFLIGRQLSKEDRQPMRKRLLLASVFLNLGLLGFFKYYNFFVDSLIESFHLVGVDLNFSTLNVILPVGISFYTFQTMSYTIDLYNRKMEHCNDWIAFFSFVSFFPQLVAGPIERAKHLLPQFYSFRKFDYNIATSGMRLILWGMFKKVVIADRLAEYVNLVFNNPGDHQGLTIILATVFFAFQIYCDFSGYSEIAIGTARLFGFDLMTNFRTPYFSASIKEFWSRWHISLSTWFRDYVYIPLGGNRVGNFRWVINLMITFIVSGFWHGANWTFMVWGFIHGLVNAVEALNSKFSLVKVKLPQVLSVIVTFAIVCFAWIFFRANTVTDAFTLIGNIGNMGFDFEKVKLVSLFNFTLMIGLISFLSAVEFNEGGLNPLRRLMKYPLARTVSYIGLIISILFFGAFENQQDFIYFQF